MTRRQNSSKRAARSRKRWIARLFVALVLVGLVIALVLTAFSLPTFVRQVSSGVSLTESAHSALAQHKLKPPAAPSNPKTDRERLIAAAYSYLGTPYKFGGKTAKELDCSGFTKLAYAGIGVTIPDGSYNQAQGEKPLTSAGELQPGDLIFYRFKPNAGVTHVTMYRGDGWVMGTGTPGQARKVSLYLLKDDLAHTNWTLTYRHITLPDEQ